MARVLPQAVADNYRAQQRLIVSTLALTRREWAGMGGDFDASWRTVGPRLLLLTASAQRGAATNGAHYVPATLAEIGQSVTPLGEVDPAAFSGWASDGRPLDSLLYASVITAKEQVGKGANATQALAAGGRWLDMAIHTQVADAGRQAASVAIAARPRVEWVRMVNPPCCQRCALLSGRVYRYSQGFARHPRCDCTMLPTTVARPDARGTTVTADDIKDLTKAQRQAIADGADMNQVINSHRQFARSKDGMTTTAGVTRRGLAGSRLKGRRRLTPEGIYKVSSTREEALQRLRDNGYIL